ncbi:MAG TPA: ElyC/SanA/YdcF family protein [Smithellaceae bacterium]|nr:ElyC/SanA/YdcF family protein [Smithellaceae bacterium]
MKVLRKSVLLPVAALLVALAGGLYLPHYLLLSTDYRKADAIILLLGPDFSARQKEAHRLIQEGMADYLIISAYDKTYRIDRGQTVFLPQQVLGERSRARNGRAPGFYEDTHLELIDARIVMDALGLRSAIFVSSPYHMRRIGVMVTREFPKGNDYYFVPTRFESAPRYFWEMTGADARKIWRESVKIVWFLMYSVWL